MKSKHIPLVFTLVLLVLIPFSLSSASLDEIITKAKGSSEEVKRYGLDKKNTDYAVDIRNVEKELGINVSSGDLSAEFDLDAGEHTLGTTGTRATFTLPNDGSTAITVSTGPVSYTTSSNYYAFNPSLSASHTILYGMNKDNRLDLLNKQSKLLSTYTYTSSIIQFENSILNQIKALLTNEKSISETLKTIVIQQKGMNDALALRSVSKDSVAYQELENSMRRLQGSLVGLIQNQELLESQYANLASQSWNSNTRLGRALAKVEGSQVATLSSNELLNLLSWDEIPSMREPELVFALNPEGNTTVALKALAQKLAQEELALAKADLTNKNLKIEGGTKFSSSKFQKVLTAGPPPTYTDVTSQAIEGSVGAIFSANTYSFGGSFSGSYNLDSQNFTPTLTVSGSWNNNPTRATEDLNILQLENSILLASISYNDALQDYLYSALSLQSQVASWNQEYALLKSTIAYNESLFNQQKALFDKGLATQSSVDNAKFAVGQDAYEKALTLVKGLVLENSIRTLHIQGDSNNE